MNSSRVMLLVSFSVLLISCTSGSAFIQDMKTYGQYDPYYPEYYPYSTYYSHSSYSVTIQISGLPSEYSTSIVINGGDSVGIQGGSTKNFEVRSIETNIFEVESQVTGPDATRYICPDPSWSLEQAQEPYTPYAYYNYPYTYYDSPYVYYHYPYSGGPHPHDGSPPSPHPHDGSPPSPHPHDQPPDHITATTHMLKELGKVTPISEETQSKRQIESEEVIGISQPAGYSQYSAPNPYHYYDDYYPSTYYYPYYQNYYSAYRSTLEASHTFTYLPEYQLIVDGPQGGSIDKSGWKQKDTVVTLATPEKINASNQERRIFKSWNVDGAEMTSNTITLAMNMPHRASATYQTEYYLEVKSELDHPQGSGWYNKDSRAIISVTPEVAMSGFWGSCVIKPLTSTVFSVCI